LTICGDFPLKQADAANFVGEADAGAGDCFGHQRRGMLLLIRVDRREDRRDSHRGEALIGNLVRRLADFGVVERGNRAAVELIAAVDEMAHAADGLHEIERPIHKGAQRGGGGQTDAQHGGAAQVASLDHGIGKVGRAEHDGVDPIRRNLAFGQQVGQHVGNPAADIFGGGRFGPPGDGAAVHQDGIGVGAANVNADAHKLGSPQVEWAEVRVG
jgi:hypothetical protein